MSELAPVKGLGERLACGVWRWRPRHGLSLFSTICTWRGGRRVGLFAPGLTAESPAGARHEARQAARQPSASVCHGAGAAGRPRASSRKAARRRTQVLCVRHAAPAPRAGEGVTRALLWWTLLGGGTAPGRPGRGGPLPMEERKERSRRKIEGVSLARPHLPTPKTGIPREEPKPRAPAQG